MSRGIAMWPTGGSGPVVAGTQWDVVTLAGSGEVFDFPGISEVVIAARKQKIDERKTQGKHGGTLTAKGVPPAEGEISCTVWTFDQWERLQKIVKRVMPKPRGAMTVAELKSKDEFRTWAIFHPNCSLLGITMVVFESVSGAVPGSVSGSRVVKFKIREFFAPEKTSKTAVKPAAPVVPLVKELRDKNATAAKPANVPAQKPSQVPQGPGPWR